MVDSNELRRKLSAAAKQIEVGSLYRHYKNPESRYRVISLAIQEATKEVCVIYQSVKGDQAPPFVRNVSVWLESVMYEGQLVSRFTRVVE